MHFVFGSFFWGMIILLIGLGIILRAFNIHIPLVRIFFGLIIILIGVKLLVGATGTKVHSTTVFDDRHWSSTSRNRDFNIIFGTGEIDLTQVDTLQLAGKRDINVIFGSGTVLLSDKMHTQIDVSTVFGDVQLPSHDIGMFGTDSYTMNAEGDSLQTLRINANAIFGDIHFKVVKSGEQATPEQKDSY